MKIFDIDACARGSYTEFDVNCPPGWFGSGCYDVEVECHQEVHFTVAAETVDEAVGMILDQFGNCHGDYCNSTDDVFYDTESVVESEDNGEGGPEILEYEPKEPVDGYDMPDRYNAEIIHTRVM